MAIFTVSGQELYSWRNTASKKAIAAKVSLKELDWLLKEISHLDSLALRIESFKDNPAIQLEYSLEELTLLWEKRLKEHLPVQYLVGRVSWRNFCLHVAPDVLIPRPETELIIEIARKHNYFPLTKESHWVDLGTGSGAIAIGLASIFPSAKIHGVDCSDSALAIAESNALATGLKTNIKFYLGEWWNPLSHLRGKVQGMVSNPPYIPSVELPKLQPEVFQHEPHLALDGGKDGLDAIRHLIMTAPQYLVPGGLWLIEMGISQGEMVKKMLVEQGNYQDIEIIHDLAGIERFVLAFRR